MASSIVRSSKAASYCDPCKQIHKRTTNVAYFCSDCRHELCNDCENHHRKTLITCNHKVTKLRDSVGKESEFQVRGRRPVGDAAESGWKMGVDQRTYIIRRVQGVTLSTGSGRSSTADREDRVFKTASQKKGLNVSVASDAGPCDIWGIVLLQDRIIVSDKANSKLKVFDPDYTFQFEHKCGNKPFDIDMVDNITVVVSLGGRKIKVLFVGRDCMAELVNINTEYPCYGVCCHDGKMYCVVSEELKSQWYSEIREYTLDGTLKHKLDYLSDGEVDCNQLTYITVNPQTGILYVTDFDEGVVALTTNGQVTAVTSPPQLNKPQGIAVDGHGQIYVCGWRSDNVIQMSESGHYVAELLSNSPKYKGAQCVRMYGNKMFFARCESGTVFIYELY